MKNNFFLKSKVECFCANKREASPCKFSEIFILTLELFQIFYLNKEIFKKKVKIIMKIQTIKSETVL